MSQFSPAAILYDHNGVAVAVKDGVAIPANTPGPLILGKISTDPPSYAAGQAAYLSMNRAGALRVDDASRPVSAFGFPLVTEITPVTQQHFTYGLSPRQTMTMTSAGSSVVGSGQAGSGADCVISIPVTANAFAIARSHCALHYRPGVGQVVLLTAAFNAGVASSQQFAGAWSAGSGYFVGYNGTVWGATARLGGTQEIRTLTVTTAATSATNVTVTIDGTALTVPVTNQTGNPSRTAWEIASFDYSGAGSAGTMGWNAYALGAVVYFIANRARVNAGAFTYGAGTSGSAATFATVRSGVAENDDFGSPATPGNWTWIDALDGTGPSGLNLNKQKGIIYGLSFGHLGHRGCRVFVMNPNTGRLIPIADYKYMNTSTASAMNNPTVYVAWGIVANGSTTAMTMYAGSGMGGLEGKKSDEEGEPYAVSASKTATNATAVHYLSIKNAPVAGLGGQTVRASRMQVHEHMLSVGVNGGSAGSYVDVDVYLNPTLNNLAVFSAVDASRLGVWKDNTSSAVVTGGQLIASIRVPDGMSHSIPLEMYMDSGETLSVIVTASAANMSVDTTLHGKEIQ